MRGRNFWLRAAREWALKTGLLAALSAGAATRQTVQHYPPGRGQHATECYVFAFSRAVSRALPLYASVDYISIYELFRLALVS